jgi:general secretion pathway protein B
MSYILDALRRADAERERGAVPGLSSQQHAYVEDDAAKPRRPRALLWAVVALAAALVLALAWNFVGRTPTPRPVVEGSVSAPPPATAVPAPTPLPAPLPAPVPAAPPQAAALPSTAGETESAAPPPAARAAARHAAEPKRVRRSAESESGTQPSALNANATTAKAADTKTAERTGRATEPKITDKAPRAQGDARVYQQSELPEDVRRDLPKIVIGGSSYSGDAASRMVMVNGQIFHEGDQLAPQLVLERIRPKSAVFSYKGYRYEVTF